MAVTPPTWPRSPSPGRCTQYAAAGNLVNLSEWFNTEQLEADLVPGLCELGSSDGNLYGVFYKTDVKSIVWYPIAGIRGGRLRAARPPGTS